MVVLWSDHGWHLGEKGITGKNSLWERSTRVPLVMAGPGVCSGAVCVRPAELLDLFPTLIDLCGLTPRQELEGHSLVPQLEDANSPRQFPAITTHNRGSHSVRSERWRFIHYADGTEELYDHRDDPHEWKNLANDARFADVKRDHSRWLPAREAKPAPKRHALLESGRGHLVLGEPADRSRRVVQDKRRTEKTDAVARPPVPAKPR